MSAANTTRSATGHSGALYADPRARIASAEDLIATMDEDGVDVSVAMGIGWSDYGAAREANDYIIEATSQLAGDA